MAVRPACTSPRSRTAEYPGFVCTVASLAGDGAHFLLGCPLHSGIAGMPRLVFCRAGLIVDKLGVQL